MIKRIVLAGNNQIAVDILKYLMSQKVQIVGLILHPFQFSRKRSTLQKITSLPNSRIIAGDKLHDRKVLEEIKQLEPDLILSINFRYLFPQNILAVPKFGSINLHFGYLPYNRGVNADVWSIIDNTPAGVTYHLIDPNIDTGDIVSQIEVQKTFTDTAGSLYKRLTDAAYKLFVRSWPSIQAWNFILKKQDKKGTYHCRKDLQNIDQIDLDKKYTARELIDILRARTFPPYNGAYFKTPDGKKIYLRLALRRE